MKPCFQKWQKIQTKNGVYRLKGIHLPDIQANKKSDQSYKNHPKTDRQYVINHQCPLKKKMFKGGYPRSETLTYPDPIILQKCSQRPVAFPSWSELLLWTNEMFYVKAKNNSVIATISGKDERNILSRKNTQKTKQKLGSHKRQFQGSVFFQVMQ